MKKGKRTPDKRSGRGSGPKPPQGRAAQDSLLREAVDHHRSGRLDEAERRYEEILKGSPSDSGVLSMLGVLRCQRRDFGRGIPLMEKAVSLSPDVPSFRCNLANALNELGRTADALAACEKAVSLKQDYAEAHFIRGICLKRLGRKQDAAASYREAVRHDPGMYRAYLNLGVILRETGDLEGAVSHFRKALELNPDYAEAHNNLGNAYKSAGNTSRAIECFREAVRIRPDYADAYTNMAGACKDRGEIEEAIRLDEKALELNPFSGIFRSNLLLTLHYSDAYGPEEVFRRHTEWFRMHAPQESGVSRSHANDPSPERRLRIGYVSPDLKTHSVAFFFEPLLEAHDRESFEIFCYADVPDPDPVTARLRGMSDAWRDISETDAAGTAALIAGDGIDILVDLAGHTGRKQMDIFARKPAPVQVTWLGYPDTTGLPTVDYRITDAHADPPGLTEHLNTERLVRLPGSFLCYRPPGSCPEPAQSPPVMSTGHVTFGSFNNRAKVTARVIETWAEILRAVPGSRLVIKANSLSDAGTRDHMLSLFRASGIEEDRVTLHGFLKSMTEHFSLYNGVDIALDTFPYNGTTTTFEALWMGVPVIALAGASHVSRVSASILSNLGLEELLACSREEYVQKAAVLAGDTERLAGLRRGLRRMMEQSPLMDAGAFTGSLEREYREMWRTWCAGRASADRPGRAPDALERLKTAAALNPGSAEAHQALCSAFRRAGRIDDAVSFYTDAVSANPDSGELRFQLANLLKDSGRADEALAWYGRALEKMPDDVRVLNNTGNLLNARERLQEAIDCYSRAAALAPGNAYVHSNLGAALKNQGRVAEAIDCQEEALRLKPDLASALSNLAACLNNVEHPDRAHVFEIHSRWADMLAPAQGMPPDLHDNDPDAWRKIRIGYVSPDLRTHSVAYFIEPVLGAHSRREFEVFCYANVDCPDAMTERLRGLSDHWRNISGMDEARAAGLIRQDRIDILVDLAGHTEKNSLPVFALKPAPVQVTWLGYPNTTGLKAMDYRITDSLSDPPGDNDRYYSEELVRLPGPFLCYRPSDGAPDISPATGTGPVTFGSFNSLAKITPAVVRVWSSILSRVPGSRLVVKAKFLSDPGTRARLADLFRDNNVTPDRLVLSGPTESHAGHLQAYQAMDIALDTFPYNGTTTTFEALWMGVPVITLEGYSHVSRVGLSILSHAGLRDLVAGSEEDYVHRAVSLAGDAERLALLRRSLRDLLRKSPLTDAAAFTRGLETAYRGMWARWCGERGERPGRDAPASRRDAAALFRDAVLRHRSGDLTGAETLYRRVLGSDPQNPDALHLLGVLLSLRKEYDQAITCFSRALAVKPGLTDAYRELSAAFRRSARLEDAASFYTSLLQAAGDNGELHYHLANALRDTGRPGPAMDHYRKALGLLPSDARVFDAMGSLLQNAGRLQEAVSVYRDALGLNPDNAFLHNNLAGALKDQGRLDESVRHFREALRLKPDFALAHSNLLFSIHCLEDVSPEEIFGLHQLWDSSHAERMKPLARPHDNDPSPDRVIRIGYVSPDFRTHSVAYFIEPVIRSHSLPGFEVFCYSTVTGPDAVTERFRSLGVRWLDIAGMREAEAAELIRSDGIDILVDLAGHTSAGSMLLFSARPAPVQVTYLGYPDTTGLKTMDYRITDSLADPPGLTERFTTEELVRLPRSFLCYTPLAETAVPRLHRTGPGNEPGRIVFGSFNNRSKITAGVVKAWSLILKSLPGSSLLIKARHLSDRETGDLLRSLFEQNGVARDRIELLDYIPSKSSHLELYNRIDIALDTFPYNGTTTTCEALWMGVPVIALQGGTHVSRVGLSILTNVGLPDLVARSIDDYVRKAVDLASDRERLARLHGNIGEMFMRSPLMDAECFTRSLEREYRGMWQRWCIARAGAAGPKPRRTAERASSPEEKALALVREGEDLFGRGDLEQARKAFLEALEIDPENAEALNDLGVICWQGNHLEEGLLYFRRALRADPSNTDALQNLNDLLQSMKG